jgi:hypothetical protein
MEKLLKSILILAIILAFTEFSSAQSEFTVKDLSKIYWAKISVDKFVNNDCSGPGTVILYNKATNNLFQSFKSDNLCFYVESNIKPSNGYELHGGESPLFFDDYNIDG